jgi:hypothetical protein
MPSESDAWDMVVSESRFTDPLPESRRTELCREIIELGREDSALPEYDLLDARMSCCGTTWDEIEAVRFGIDAYCCSAGIGRGRDAGRTNELALRLVVRASSLATGTRGSKGTISPARMPYGTFQFLFPSFVS